MMWLTPISIGLSISLLNRTPVVQKSSLVESELRLSSRMW